MSDKIIYLVLAILFTGMGMAGALPVLVLGAIYFYVFITYDERERKKEEERKIWLQKREEERIEKERIAKIKSDERMTKLEKIRQERLRKEAEETKRAIERQKFSYVYVLSNLSMPGIIKIGYTDKNPRYRAAEISNATGVPTPFKVLKEYPFATLTRAQKEEKRLHSLFEKHRLNANREFFRLSVDQVDSEIRDTIKTEELSYSNLVSQKDEEVPKTEKTHVSLSVGSGTPHLTIKKDSDSFNERFIQYRNGIVIDKNTGLEWYACPQMLNYNDAERWIASLSVDGKNWRMPNENELRSLYNPDLGPRAVTPFLSSTGGWCVWANSGSSSFSREVLNFGSTLGTTGWRTFPNDGQCYKVFAVRKRIN